MSNSAVEYVAWRCGSDPGGLAYLRDYLNSWPAAGFRPVAVNGPSEIKVLRGLDLPVEFAALSTTASRA
jgi:hypothetical protein